MSVRRTCFETQRFASLLSMTKVIDVITLRHLEERVPDARLEGRTGSIWAGL